MFSTEKCSTIDRTKIRAHVNKHHVGVAKPQLYAHVIAFARPDSDRTLASTWRNLPHGRRNASSRWREHIRTSENASSTSTKRSSVSRDEYQQSSER